MQALQQLWSQKVANKGHSVVLSSFHYGQVSICQVDAAAERVVTSLIKNGVNSGDGVAFVSSDDDVIDIIVLLACLKLGAIWCPIRTKESLHIPVRAVVETISENKTMLDICVTVTAFNYVEKKYPDDALYCIGTSGTSSNQPRAVLGSATMTLRRLQWGWKKFPQISFILRRTPIIFVDSIAEILGPLLSANEQILILKGNARHDQWLSLIDKNNLHRTGLLIATPSVLQVMLVEEGRVFENFGVIVSSGEPLSKRVREAVAAKLQGTECCLVNIYGSAEVSADVSYAVLEPASKREHCCDICLAESISPIGAELESSIRIDLNGREQIVVQGRSALGYVSYIGVSEKFGETIATGDIGTRCSQCNALRCLGRGDDIFNVCGVKVRLTDLEAQFGGVAVPRINYDYPASSRIDLYTNVKINSFVHVPSYVKLRSLGDDIHLPRGPTGKLDKRAVRTKSTLNNIFSQLLHDDDNDSDESFFARGGNSLTAIQALHHLRAEFPQAVIEMNHLHTNISQLTNHLAPFLSLEKNGLILKQDTTIQNIDSRIHEIRTTSTKRQRLDFRIYSRDHFQFDHNKKESPKNFLFRIAWTVHLGKCVDAPPLIVSENNALCVYIGSHAKRFVCCDGHTGRIEWETKVGDHGIQRHVLSDASIEAGACATSDHIFIGAYDATLYCLSRTQGKIIWTYSVFGEIKNAATICSLNRRIIFGAHDKSVHCVDACSGHQLWSLQNLSGAVFGTPLIIKDEVVIFATTDAITPSIYCVRLLDGAFVWQHTLPGPAFAAPVFAHNKIFLGTVDGTVSAIDATTGKSRWGFASSKRDAGVFARALVCDNMVIFAANDGSLKARDDLNYGKLLWTFYSTAPVFAAPARLNTEFILIAATDGTLDLISLLNGISCTRISLHTRVFSSPVPIFPYYPSPLNRKRSIDDEAQPPVIARIFVGARDDTLKAIDLCCVPSSVASSDN